MGTSRGALPTNSEKENAVDESVTKRLAIQTEGKGPQQGTGIRCPACDGQTRVVRTLPKPGESIQGRYRVCDTCGTRIYTEESVLSIIPEKEKKD